VFSSTFGLGDHQKRLETLSLITDGGCNADLLGVLDLTEFSRIQSFTWRGLNRGDDFWSLGKFVNANAKGIKTLSLDLVDWEKAENTWYDFQRAMLGGFPDHPDNFFARKVLEVQRGEENILFQSLNSLLLSAVSFELAEPEMMYAFNMCNLSTLRLWNCPSCLILLEDLIGMAKNIRLKSFELVIDPTCLASHTELGEREEGDIVARFLNAFHGLEDLSLMLTLPVNWDVIFKGILNHVSTLRRLTIHNRDFHLEDFSCKDGSIPWSDQKGILFKDPRLSYIGTSGSPSQLVGLFHFPPPYCLTFQPKH
jgi:hypothetical protein